MNKLSITICFYALSFTSSVVRADLKSPAPSNSKITALCVEALSWPGLIGKVEKSLKPQKRNYVQRRVDIEASPNPLVGPRALADLNPNGVSFQKEPAQWAAGSHTIRLDEPHNSFPLILETKFAGEKLKATTYVATLPGLTFDKLKEKKNFLFGKEYVGTGVIFWMHGGGTKTASGVNGLSVALHTLKRDIPVFSPDLPSHGGGTLFPFLSGLEQAQYLVNMMKDNIDPEVPIFIDGHSWGGQMALIMYLNFHKLDWGNLNVKGFMSLSPPADLSLGGTFVDRRRTEKQVHACRSEWRHLVASTDNQFIDNIVENLKPGPVPAVQCAVTNLDYKWVLPDDNRPRPPIMVIVGKADGLVFVGREKVYIEFLEKLIGRENLVIMDSGYNEKSKHANDEHLTGHNIYYRYLTADQRQALEDFLGPEVNKEKVYEVYTRIAHFVQKHIGKNLRGDRNRTGSGASAQVENRQGLSSNTPEDLVDVYYRRYANDLTFREFINDHQEVIIDTTPEWQKTLDESSRINKKISRAEARLSIELEQISRKMAVQERKIGEKYPEVGNLAFFAIQREFDFIARATPERRRELTDFLNQARPILEELRGSAPTEDQLQNEILKINPLPAGFDTLAKAELEYSRLSELKEKKEVDRDGLPLITKDQVAVLAQLRGYFAKFKQAENSVRKVSIQNLSQLFLETIKAKGIALPSDIMTIGDAEREMRVDPSPDRKTKLEAVYVEMKYHREVLLPEQLADATARAQQEMAISAGYSSYGLMMAQLKMIEAVADDSYVPQDLPVDRERLLKDLTAKIKKDVDRQAKINQEIEGSKEFFMRQYQKQVADRSRLIKAIDQAIRESSHSELEALRKSRDSALQQFIYADGSYDHFVSTQIAFADQNGILSREFLETLQNQKVELFAKRFLSAQTRFIGQDSALRQKGLELAANGQLGTEVQKKIRTVQDMDAKIAAAAAKRDQLLRESAVVEVELSHLREEYYQAVPGHFVLHRISVYEILNRPLGELLAILNDKSNLEGQKMKAVLQKSLKRYEDMRSWRDSGDAGEVEIN